VKGKRKKRRRHLAKKSDGGQKRVLIRLKDRRKEKAE